MSFENTTYALQVNATSGNGFSVFFSEANFVTFRITGDGTVTAGTVTIEQKVPGKMTDPVGQTDVGTWTALTTIAIPSNATTDYFAGIQFGTLRARISTLF